MKQYPQVPSANVHANAFALARLASSLAKGGRLLSARALDSALGGAVVRADAELETSTKNVNAGWSVFDEDVPDDRGGYVGWQVR